MGPTSNATFTSPKKEGCQESKIHDNSTLEHTYWVFPVKRQEATIMRVTEVKLKVRWRTNATHAGV